jgi:hypothetical protein
MRVLKEITEWNIDFKLNNHTYFVSDNREKMYGYIKSSGDIIETFKKPYPFNSRGRKFKEIENTWGFNSEELIEPTQDRTWEVVGSKGDKYVVTEVGDRLVCSCPGSKYRGTCKHAQGINLAV